MAHSQNSPILKGVAQKSAQLNASAANSINILLTKYRGLDPSVFVSSDSANAGDRANRGDMAQMVRRSLTPSLRSRRRHHPTPEQRAAKIAQMQLDTFAKTLARTSLNLHDFSVRAHDLELLKDIEPKSVADWRLLGLPLVKSESLKMTLSTRFCDISEQVFCVVDIESTGSIHHGQMIELGAVKVKNGKELERFESFVYCDLVPEVITEITGICTADLEGAPSLKSVLERFRLFLGDAVFVAHNANFDYGFITYAMQNAGFGPLLNRRICTVELSRRTIAAQRYSLGHLKELLGITSQHHRALSDALAAAELLNECIARLPFSVQTTEDLITFCATAKMLKLPPSIISEPPLPLEGI